MRRMGIEALYRKPHLSRRHPAYTIYICISSASILLPSELRPPSRHGPIADRGGGAMPDDASAEPIERWTAKRRATLVLSILKGETSVAEAARCHGLTVAEVED